MKTLRRLILIVLVLLAIGAYVAPWKQWLEKQLLAQLQAQGLQDVQLTVDSLTTEGVALKNISFRANALVSAEHLTLRYVLPELIHGSLHTLTGTAEGVRLKTKDMAVDAASAQLDLARGETQEWKGNWKVSGMNIRDAALPLPPLAGEGTLDADAVRVAAKGIFASADKTHRAQFTLNYLPATPEKSAAELSASLPWNGGTLSVNNVQMAFKKQPVTLALRVEKVSLQTLMQSLTGQRASGTGAVSGTLPVTIMPDGKLLIGGGGLKADEPGIIQLSPEAIPGDNPQVSLVRDILKNLHYTLLSIAMQNEKNNKLSVLISLEGKNPDVYAGRPVKLNVHLTGDLLNFMQQSMLITNPDSLLRQENNAKDR